MNCIHDFFAGMKTISGSVVGGTKVTQEMIDFCAAHKIYPNIERSEERRVGKECSS